MKNPGTLLRSLALGLFAMLAAPLAAAGGTAYTLAVLPSAPPVTMHSLWLPFVTELSKATGFEFHLKHYERMADFEREIWNGTPDLIFSSPIQMSVAHTAAGYIPLVRGRQAVAVGLFVRADSPIRSVDDVMGKKISFVGNKNVCSVAMQHLLAKRSGKLVFDKEYAGSTRNVIINVLLGKTDAGAIFLPDLARETDDTRAQLRQLVLTPDMASHPLSAHPRVPAAVRSAIVKAVLAMAATPGGAATLEKLRLPDPVPADYAKDYAALEEMDVKVLTNWGQ
jgi:phosphonate transport system substrate-binding protein